ncbi:Hypothetical protein GLP15_896 [Giardia lamblia P15]|uniref:Uncharacterized protein n=1 Tax=Giardia intestinalis (strain P15) TaxID=658858 RepID=E1EZI0_GIAIA|nr:Hypothetical protein GLP15_896 [Giardia lamblia P15]
MLPLACRDLTVPAALRAISRQTGHRISCDEKRAKSSMSQFRSHSPQPSYLASEARLSGYKRIFKAQNPPKVLSSIDAVLRPNEDRKEPVSPPSELVIGSQRMFTMSPKFTRNKALGIDPRSLAPSDNIYYKAAEFPNTNPEFYSNQPPPITSNLPDTAYSKAIHPPTTEDEIRRVGSVMSVLRPTDAAPRLEKAQAADFLLEQLIENSVQILHGLGLSRIYETNQTQNWYECEVIAKMGDKFEVYFPAINHKKVVTLKNLILKQITITQASDITLPILPSYALQNSDSITAATNAIPIFPGAQSSVRVHFPPPSEQKDESTVVDSAVSFNTVADKPAVVLPPRKKSKPAPHTADSDSHYQLVPITLDDMIEATDSQHINLFDESFDNSSVAHAITQPSAHIKVSSCMPCVSLDSPSSMSASESTLKSELQTTPELKEPSCANLSAMADMLSDLINEITPAYNTSLFGKRPSSCRLNIMDPHSALDVVSPDLHRGDANHISAPFDCTELYEATEHPNNANTTFECTDFLEQVLHSASPEMNNDLKESSPAANTALIEIRDPADILLSIDTATSKTDQFEISLKPLAVPKEQDALCTYTPIQQIPLTPSRSKPSRTIDLVSLLGITTHTELINVFLECIDHFTLKDRFATAVRYLSSEILHRKVQNHQYLSIFTTSVIAALLELRLPHMSHASYTIDCVTDYREAQIRLDKVRFKCDADRLQALQNLAHEKELLYKKLCLTFQTKNLTTSSAVELCSIGIKSAQPILNHIRTSKLTLRLETLDPPVFNFQQTMADAVMDYLTNAQTTDLQIQLIQEASVNTASPIHWCHTYLASFLWNTSKYYLTAQNPSIVNYMAQTVADRRLMMERGIAALSNISYLSADRAMFLLFRQVTTTIEDYIGYLTLTPDLLLVTGIPFYPNISPDILGSIVFTDDYEQKEKRLVADNGVSLDPDQKVVMFDGYSLKKRLGYRFFPEVQKATNNTAHEHSISLDNIINDTPSRSLFIRIDKGINFMQKLDFYLTNSFILLFEILIPYIQETLLNNYDQKVQRNLEKMIKIEKVNSKRQNLPDETIEKLAIQAQNSLKHGYIELEKQIEVYLYRLLSKVFEDTVFPLWLGLIHSLLHSIDVPEKRDRYALHSGTTAMPEEAVSVLQHHRHRSTDATTLGAPTKNMKGSTGSGIDESTLRATDLYTEHTASFLQMPESVELESDSAPSSALVSGINADADNLLLSHISAMRGYNLSLSFQNGPSALTKLFTPEIANFFLQLQEKFANIKQKYQQVSSILFTIPYTRPIFENLDVDLSYFQADMAQGSLDTVKGSIEHVLNVLSTLVIHVIFETNSYGLISNISFDPSSDSIYSGLLCFIFDLVDFYSATPTLVNVLLNRRVNTQVDIVDLIADSAGVSVGAGVKRPQVGGGGERTVSETIQGPAYLYDNEPALDSDQLVSRSVIGMNTTPLKPMVSPDKKDTSTNSYLDVAKDVVDSFVVENWNIFKRESVYSEYIKMFFDLDITACTQSYQLYSSQPARTSRNPKKVPISPQNNSAIDPFETADLKIPHAITKRKRQLSRVASRLRNDPPVSGLKLMSVAKLALTNMSIYLKSLQNDFSAFYHANLSALRDLFNEAYLFPREIYTGSKTMLSLYSLFRSKLKALRKNHTKQINGRLAKELGLFTDVKDDVENKKIPVEDMVASAEVVVSEVGTISHSSINASRFYLDETSCRDYFLPINHTIASYLQSDMMDKFLFTTEPVEHSSRKYEEELRKSVAANRNGGIHTRNLIFDELLLFTGYLRQPAVVAALCQFYIPGDKPPEILSKHIIDITNTSSIITRILSNIYGLSESYYAVTALPPVCFYGAIKIDYSNYLATVARQAHELYVLYLNRLDDYCRLVHECGVTCIEHITRNLMNTHFDSAASLGAVYFIFKNFAIFYPKWRDYYAWFNDVSVCLGNMIIDGGRAALLHEKLLYYRTQGSLMLMRTFKSMENRSQSVSQCYQKLISQLTLIDNWILSTQDALFQRIREYIRLNTQAIALCDEAPAKFARQYDAFTKNFVFPRAVRNLHDKSDLLDITAVLKSIDSATCLPFLSSLSDCVKRREPSILQLFHRDTDASGAPIFRSVDFPAAFIECEDIAHHLILLCEALIRTRKDALALNMYPYNDKTLFPTDKAILDAITEDRNLSAIDAVIFYDKDIDTAKTRTARRDYFLKQLLDPGESLKLSSSTVDAILHPNAQQGPVLTRLRNLLPLLFLINKLVALYFDFLSNFEQWMNCTIGRLSLSDVKNFVVQVVITATIILETLKDSVPISELARTLLQFITKKRSQLQLFFILKSSLYKINFIQSPNPAKNVCLSSFEAMEVVTNRLLLLSDLEPLRTNELGQLLGIIQTNIDEFLCIDPRDLHVVGFYVRDLLKYNRSKYSDETKVKVFLEMVSNHECSIMKSYRIGLHRVRAERFQYIQSSLIQRALADKENRVNPDERLEFLCHFLVSRTGEFVLETTVLQAQVLEVVSKYATASDQSTMRTIEKLQSASRKALYSFHSEELSGKLHDLTKVSMSDALDASLEIYEEGRDTDSVKTVEPDEKLAMTAALAQKEGIVIRGPIRDAVINASQCFSTGVFYESCTFGYIAYQYFSLFILDQDEKDSKQSNMDISKSSKKGSNNVTAETHRYNSSLDRIKLLGSDEPVIYSRVSVDYSPLNSVYLKQNYPNFLDKSHFLSLCYHADFTLVGDRRGKLLFIEKNLVIKVPRKIFELDLQLQYDLLGLQGPFSHTTEQRPVAPTCMALRRLTIIPDINLHIFTILCAVLQNYVTFDSLASHLFDLDAIHQLVSLQWRVYLLMSRCIFIISYVRAHANKLFYYVDMQTLCLQAKSLPVLVPAVHTRTVTHKFLTLLYKTQTLLSTAQSNGATMSNIASRKVLRDSIFGQIKDIVEFESEIIAANMPFLQHLGTLRNSANFPDSYMLSRQFLVSSFIESIIYDNFYSPIICSASKLTECRGAVVCSLPARVITACSTVLSNFGFHKMQFVIYKVVSLTNGRSFYIFAGVLFGMDLHEASGRQQEYLRFCMPILLDRLPHCFTILTYSMLQTTISASLSWYVQYYSDLLVNDALNRDIALCILRSIPLAAGVLAILRLFHILVSDSSKPGVNSLEKLRTLKTAMATLMYVLNILFRYQIITIPSTYMSLVHRSVCTSIDRYLDPSISTYYHTHFTIDFEALEEQFPYNYQYYDTPIAKTATLEQHAPNEDSYTIPCLDLLHSSPPKDFRRETQKDYMAALLHHNKHHIKHVTILGPCTVLPFNYLYIRDTSPLDVQLSSILQETFTSARYRLFRDILISLSNVLSDIIEDYAEAQPVLNSPPSSKQVQPFDNTSPVVNLYASHSFVSSIFVSGGDESLFRLLDDFSIFAFQLLGDYLHTYNRDFITSMRFFQTRASFLGTQQAFTPMHVYSGATPICIYEGHVFLDASFLDGMFTKLPTLPIYSEILHKLVFYKLLFIVSPINDGPTCNSPLKFFFSAYVPFVTGHPVVFDQPCLVDDSSTASMIDKEATYFGSLLSMLVFGSVIIITSEVAMRHNWATYMSLHEERVRRDLPGSLVFILPGLIKTYPDHNVEEPVYLLAEKAVNILSLYGLSQESNYLIRYRDGFVNADEAQQYIHDVDLSIKIERLAAKFSQLSVGSQSLSNTVLRSFLSSAPSLLSGVPLPHLLRNYLLLIAGTLKDSKARMVLTVMFVSTFGTSLLDKDESRQDIMPFLTELTERYATSSYYFLDSDMKEVTAAATPSMTYTIPFALMFSYAFSSLQYIKTSHTELRFFSEPARLAESEKRLSQEFHLNTSNIRLCGLLSEFYLQFFGRDILANFPFSTTGFYFIFNLICIILLTLTQSISIGPIGLHVTDLPLCNTVYGIVMAAVRYLVSDMITIELRFQNQCGLTSKRLNLADPIEGEESSISHPSFVEVTDSSQITDVATGRVTYRPYTVYFMPIKILDPAQDITMLYEILLSAPRPSTTAIVIMSPCLRLLQSFTGYHLHSQHSLLNPKLLLQYQTREIRYYHTFKLSSISTSENTDVSYSQFEDLITSFSITQLQRLMQMKAMRFFIQLSPLVLAFCADAHLLTEPQDYYAAYCNFVYLCSKYYIITVLPVIQNGFEPANLYGCRETSDPCSNSISDLERLLGSRTKGKEQTISQAAICEAQTSTKDFEELASSIVGSAVTTFPGAVSAYNSARDKCMATSFVRHTARCSVDERGLTDVKRPKENNVFELFNISQNKLLCTMPIPCDSIRQYLTFSQLEIRCNPAFFTCFTYCNQNYSELVAKLVLIIFGLAFSACKLKTVVPAGSNSETFRRMSAFMASSANVDDLYSDSQDVLFDFHEQAYKQCREALLMDGPQTAYSIFLSRYFLSTNDEESLTDTNEAYSTAYNETHGVISVDKYVYVRILNSMLPTAQDIAAKGDAFLYCLLLPSFSIEPMTYEGLRLVGETIFRFSDGDFDILLTLLNFSTVHLHFTSAFYPERYILRQGIDKRPSSTLHSPTDVQENRPDPFSEIADVGYLSAYPITSHDAELRILSLSIVAAMFCKVPVVFFSLFSPLFNQFALRAATALFEEDTSVLMQDDKYRENMQLQTSADEHIKFGTFSYNTYLIHSVCTDTDLIHLLTRLRSMCQFVSCNSQTYLISPCRLIVLIRTHASFLHSSALIILLSQKVQMVDNVGVIRLVTLRNILFLVDIAHGPSKEMLKLYQVSHLYTVRTDVSFPRTRRDRLSTQGKHYGRYLLAKAFGFRTIDRQLEGFLLDRNLMYTEHFSASLGTIWLMKQYYSMAQSNSHALNDTIAAIVYNSIEQTTTQYYEQYPEIYNALYGVGAGQRLILELATAPATSSTLEALTCGQFLVHTPNQGILLKQLIDAFNINLLKVLINRSLYFHFMNEYTERVGGRKNRKGRQRTATRQVSIASRKSGTPRSYCGSRASSLTVLEENIEEGTFFTPTIDLSYYNSMKSEQLDDKSGESSNGNGDSFDTAVTSAAASSPRDLGASGIKPSQSPSHKVKWLKLPMAQQNSEAEEHTENAVKLPAVVSSLMNKDVGTKYLTKLSSLTGQDYFGVHTMELKSIIAEAHLSPMRIPATLFVPSGLLNYIDFILLVKSLPGVVDALPIDSRVHPTDKNSILLVDIAAACGLTDRALPPVLQTMSVTDRFLTALRAATCAAMGMPPSAAYPRIFERFKKQAFSGIGSTSESSIHLSSGRSSDMVIVPQHILSTHPLLAIPRWYSHINIQTQTLIQYKASMRTKTEFHPEYVPYNKYPHQFNTVILAIPLSLAVSCNLLTMVANFLYPGSGENGWINKEDQSDFLSDFSSISKLGLATTRTYLCLLGCTMQVVIFDNYCLQTALRKDILAVLPPHLDVVHFHVGLSMHKDIASITKSPLIRRRLLMPVLTVSPTANITSLQKTAEISEQLADIRVYIVAYYLYDALVTQFSNCSIPFSNSVESLGEANTEHAGMDTNQRTMTAYSAQRSTKDLTLQSDESSTKVDSEIRNPHLSYSSARFKRSVRSGIQDKCKHTATSRFVPYSNINDFILIVRYVYRNLRSYYASKLHDISIFQQKSINLIKLAKHGSIQTQQMLASTAENIAQLAATIVPEEELDEEKYKESTRALHEAEKRLATIKQELNDAEARVKAQKEKLKNSIEGSCAAIMYFGDSKLASYVKAVLANPTKYHNFTELLCKIPVISSAVEAISSTPCTALPIADFWNIAATEIFRSCERLYSLLVGFDQEKDTLDSLTIIDSSAFDGIEMIIFTWYIETREYKRFKDECVAQFKLEDLQSNYANQQDIVSTLTAENRVLQQACQSADKTRSVSSSQLDLLETQLCELKELFQIEKDTIGMVVKHIPSMVTEERRMRQMHNLSYVHGVIVAATMYFGIGLTSTCIDVLSKAGGTCSSEECCAFCSILNLPLCSCCSCCLCLCDCKYVMSDTGATFLVKADVFGERSICRHMKRKDQVVSQIFLLLHSEFSRQRLLKYKLQTDQFRVLEFASLLVLHKVFKRPIFASRYAVRDLPLLADCMGALDPSLSVHTIRVNKNLSTFCSAFRRALLDVHTRVIALEIVDVCPAILDILIAFTVVYPSRADTMNEDTNYSIQAFSIKTPRPLSQYCFIVTFDINSVDPLVYCIEPVIVNPSILQMDVLEFPWYALLQNPSISADTLSVHQPLSSKNTEASLLLHKDTILQHTICHYITGYHTRVLEYRTAIVELESVVERQLQMCISQLHEVENTSYTAKASIVYTCYRTYLDQVDTLATLSDKNKSILTERAKMENDKQSNLNVAIKIIMAINNYLLRLALSYPTVLYPLMYMQSKPFAHDIDDLDCSLLFLLEIADNLYRALPLSIFIPTLILAIVVSEMTRGTLTADDYQLFNSVMLSVGKVPTIRKENIDTVSPFNLYYAVQFDSSGKLVLTSKEAYCLAVLRKAHPKIDFSVFTTPLVGPEGEPLSNAHTTRNNLMIYLLRQYSEKSPKHIHNFLRTLGEPFYCKIIALVCYGATGAQANTSSRLACASKTKLPGSSIGLITRIAQSASSSRVVLVFTANAMQTAYALWATGFFAMSASVLNASISQGAGLVLYPCVPIHALSRLARGSVGVVDISLGIRTISDICYLLSQLSVLSAAHQFDNLLVWSERPLGLRALVAAITVPLRMRRKSPWLLSPLTQMVCTVHTDQDRLMERLIVTSIAICIRYPLLFNKVSLFFSISESVLSSNQWYFQQIQARYKYVITNIKQIQRLCITEANTLECIVRSAHGFSSLTEKAGLHPFVYAFDKLTLGIRDDVSRQSLASLFTFMTLLLLQLSPNSNGDGSVSASELEQSVACTGYSVSALVLDMAILSSSNALISDSNGETASDAYFSRDSSTTYSDRIIQYVLEFTTLPDARLLTFPAQQLYKSPIRAAVLARSLLEEIAISSQKDQQSLPGPRLTTPVQAQNCDIYLVQDDCVVASLNEKNAIDA